MRIEKKLYTIAILLFTFIVGFSEVKASEIIAGANQAWKRYKVNSSWVVSKTPLLTVDGQKSYCVELNKSLKLTNNSGNSTDAIKLETFISNNSSYITKNVTVYKKTMTQANYLKLVSYYGNKFYDESVNSNDKKKYYIATQKLIWDQVLKPSISFVDKTFFTTYSGGVLESSIDISTQVTNIRTAVANYYNQRPSFCGDDLVLTLNNGKYTGSITDNNTIDILKEYSIENFSDCSISEKTLSCELTEPLSKDLEITLNRSYGTTGDSYIYSRNGGQGVLKIKQTPTVQCKVNLLTTAKAKIKVTKVDSDGNYIEGINFNVCDANDANCEKITTNVNGNAYKTVDYITGGTTYKITEEVPEQFITPSVTDSTWSPLIDTSITYYKKFTNTYKKGTVKIKKVDINNIPIKGVIFDIYKVATDTDTYELVGELTTDDNGEATSGELIYGTYYLKEIFAPDKYKFDINKKYDFSITENNQAAQLTLNGKNVENNTIVNTLQEAYIKIKKVDKKSKDALKGVKFEIYSVTEIVNEEEGSEELKLVDTITTDDNGLATTKSLLYGKYRIVEKETLKEYLLIEEPTDIVLNENKTYEVEIANEKGSQTGDIQIALIITLGLCALIIAVIAYTKRNQTLKNNAI